MSFVSFLVLAVFAAAASSWHARQLRKTRLITIASAISRIRNNRARHFPESPRAVRIIIYYAMKEQTSLSVNSKKKSNLPHLRQI